jgi:predicted pyridoxine 5'-phosphate oxidase superfamily flavin-nucleotide-binding protein
MVRNFASVAFTKEVRALQEKHGSRSSYERMEKRTVVDGLTELEVDFINKRDSFYMASMGENGFPYIQHRGGPKGFVKVINTNTVGFIDFTGNKQYITVGNLATYNKIAIIMMDYTAKARLKIYAKAEVIELKDRPDLFKLLNLEDYSFKPERMMLLHVEAFDWNCPQHITSRYTTEEIEEAFMPQRQYIKRLEEEIKELKSR